MKIQRRLGAISGKFWPNSKTTRITWMASLVFSLSLAALPWIVKLDGKPHADWQQFLGRFHPLVVHLPIGFLLLVPLLEIAGVFRPALREAASFVLGFAFAGAILALTLGMLLAYGSGDIGTPVTRHMTGGIAADDRLAGVHPGAAVLDRTQCPDFLSRVARMHDAAAVVDSRPGWLNHVWKQLFDRIHACRS